MKLSHLLQCEPSLPKLINTDLPILYAYKLNSILDDVQTQVGKLQQFRTDFINKHGDRIKDSDTFTIPKEKASLFDEGLDQIVQEEVDIQAVEIPLSVLLDTDIKLTALEINGLKNAGFIVDDINSIEDKHID